MPTYDFQCSGCGHMARDVIRSLAEYGSPCACPVCETPMRQLLSAPHIVMDYPGYTCPVTGTWVEGRAQHRENLKRQGCRVLEPGETEAVRRGKRQSDEVLDKQLDETADQLLASLPSREVEHLCNAVADGMTATVERR
jgi:putative FmdB family regulatory protein